MTMVLMTGLAMTRERERGTMENLLATPALPVEVMTGKIVPYIMIGLVQATIIMFAARYIFGVPFLGSIPLLYGVILIFSAANLTLGITFSSLAGNQLQAMQMTFFFFLPSILLSGFMFPFRGMPVWAQWIGETLPLTHFVRLVRGILLKGDAWPELWPSIWPLLLFTLLVITVGLRLYRKTLDKSRQTRPRLRRSAATAPAVACRAMALKRLHNNQDHDGNQYEYRKLVQPAIEQVRTPVAVVLEVGQQLAAIDVIGDQNHHQRQFGVQPTARDAVTQPQPQAEHHGEQPTRCHDAVEEFSLHDLETLDAHLVFGHGVVDKQPRQVEQASEPGNHEDDVQS